MLKLETIVDDDYDAIRKLTSLKQVMKYVGNGKLWNDKKIKNR